MHNPRLCRTRLRNLNDFAARSRGQGGQDGIGLIAQKVNRAIGKQEISSVGMQAPVMKEIALVGEPAFLEMVRARRALGDVAAAGVPFPRPKKHVRRAGPRLTITGVPPAVPEIGAGRPFAGQDGQTGAIGDLG